MDDKSRTIRKNNIDLVVSNGAAQSPPFKPTTLMSTFYCHITIKCFNFVVSPDLYHSYIDSCIDIACQILSFFFFMNFYLISPTRKYKLFEGKDCILNLSILCSTQLGHRHLVNICCFFFKSIIMSYVIMLIFCKSAGNIMNN